MSNMAQDSESERIRLFSGELDEMVGKEVAKRQRLGNDVSAMVFGRDVGDLARQLAADAPAMHHQNSIGKMQDFFEL